MTRAIIIVLLILIILYLLPKKETFEPVNIEIIPTKTAETKPYIKFYDTYNKKTLIYKFEPIISDRANNYLRKIFKINLKSLELNLPKREDGSDDQRTIEIWSMYPDSNTSSLQSDFYNSYTEPDYGRDANPGKYKLLVKLKAGEKVSANIMEPVKKIFVFARL